MTDHPALARQYFTDGYNCSQAVLLAFSDMIALDEKTASLISSSFGGGMARMREVCGAVTGAIMVLGLLKGYSDPKAKEEKKEFYHLVQDFFHRFEEEHGSYICKKLLTGTDILPGKDPEHRTKEYYKKRPCPDLVESAARILDEMLA